MVTLKQIFYAFGHDPEWSRFAAASTQPMVSVFFRKLGHRDITTITDFDLQLQLAVSDQPEDRKAKARACIDHLRQWASGHGHPFAQPEPEPEPEQQTAPETELANAEPKPKTAEKPKPKKKAAPKSATKPEPQPQPKRKPGRPPKCDPAKTEAYLKAHHINIYDSQQNGRPTEGYIYHDSSSKGYSQSGKKVYHNCWRAEINIDGQRYRHRSADRQDCEDWLKAIKQGKIHPSDNKADWWRMEQHKDEAARIEEHILSAAEEACIVADFHQTRDTQPLYDYCVRALLPHMVYYCAHTLHLGKDRTLTASRQAVGLILTKIVGGRPVTNITFTCKRMLRTYASRGDFWYYDRAPEEVKLMVNRIDMTALEELYKVTKDRRI